MRPFLFCLYIITPILIYCCNPSNNDVCNNLYAQTYILQKLHYIDTVVSTRVNKRSTIIYTTKVNETINELEQITSIISESTGNIVGRYQPTINDQIRWWNWYNTNKDFLCWDSTTKSISVSHNLMH